MALPLATGGGGGTACSARVAYPLPDLALALRPVLIGNQTLAPTHADVCALQGAVGLHGFRMGCSVLCAGAALVTTAEVGAGRRL